MSLRLSHVVALALTIAATPAIADRAPSAGFDLYGYQSYDAAPLCATNFVDIAASGTVLTFSASGANAADDDGAATVALAQPFGFYGTPISSVVVSTNGYIAAADALANEDGGDSSSDCPLPAIGENLAATQARLYVLHDELAAGANGVAYQQYFASCPRAADGGASEACTIVEWSNWTKVGTAGTFDAEAVLYHGSNEIAMQYRNLSGAFTSTATVGLQNDGAQSAALFGCGNARPIPAAVCFADPAFPLDRLFANGFDAAP